MAKKWHQQWGRSLLALFIMLAPLSIAQAHENLGDCAGQLVAGGPVVGELKNMYVDLDRELLRGQGVVSWLRSQAFELANRLPTAASADWPASLVTVSNALRSIDQDPLPALDAISKFFDDLHGGNFAARTALEELIKEKSFWWKEMRRRRRDPLSPDYSPLSSLIEYRPLPEPIVAYRTVSGTTKQEKVEIAEVMHVQDPVIQSLLSEVQSQNGQVRLMKMRVSTGPENQFAGWRHESPYFWVNLDRESPSYLVPVIGIDLNVDRALASLEHEMEHFRIWRKAFLRHRARGMSVEDATKAAVDYVWTPDMIVYGEQRAVEAEIRSERQAAFHPFNQTTAPARPTEFWQPGYINRLSYPEHQAVRWLLQRHVAGEPLDAATIKKHLTAVIRRTLDARTQSLTIIPPTEASLHSYWLSTTIRDQMILPFGIERLIQDGTLTLFDQAFREACADFGVAPNLCL